MITTTSPYFCNTGSRTSKRSAPSTVTPPSKKAKSKTKRKAKKTESLEEEEEFDLNYPIVPRPAKAVPVARNKKKKEISPSAPKPAKKSLPVTSCYFLRSPSSCYGSIDRLGPLLFTLSDKDTPRHTCRKNPSCLCCEKAVDDFVCHFYNGCEHFRSDWDSRKGHLKGHSKGLTCWEKTESRIQACTRHLCAHRCYMRAFLPVREWVALRKDLEKQTTRDIDTLLTGWKCKLATNSNDSISMNWEGMPPSASVVFVCPGDEEYSNKAKAIRAILKQEVAPGKPPKPFWKHHSPKAMPKQKAGAWKIQSPLGLLEELYSGDPWRLLVSTILLNRTSRVQVDTVFFLFLQNWPTAEDAAEADLDTLGNIIRPLGLYKKRAMGVVRFSKEYLALLKTKQEGSDEASTDSWDSSAGMNLSKKEIMSLYQCGEYACAAYEIFIRRELVDHKDHALTWYVEYQRACSGWIKNEK